MKKVILTVKETRILQRECEIPDEEYDFLLGDGKIDNSPTLDEMFCDVVDSKHADTEYDYQVYNVAEDKLVVDFYE